MIPGKIYLRTRRAFLSFSLMIQRVCLSAYPKWSGPNHILLRHPEVESFKGLIVSTIADPDSRQRDPEDDRVLLYYGVIPEDCRPFRKALFLRVVVKYVYPPERQGQRTGLISAVYFVDRVKKGAETI